MARAVRSVLLALGVLTLAATLTAQSPIRYVYDELGRLVGVIDTNGDAAVYQYDAVGNLLSITRTSATQVSIIDFTPNDGPIGQTVTIYGTGFSATASSNTVSFNGTSASITSASTTALVVTVPSGATTGTIGVTSPNGSTTSGSSFTVTVSATPTITSFSPTTGVAGTSVTVTGTNFQTTAANNQTRFNNSFTAPTGSSATTVTAPVPSSTASGRLTIKTPTGTAVSTDDFIIPPPPFTTSDVANSGRISLATATTVTVSTSGKIALRLFDVTVGERVSLLGTNGMSGQVLGCDVNASILNPYGGLLGPIGCMEGTGFLDVKPVGGTGTHTILIDPQSTATGSVTLTVYSVPADYTSTITAGGSAVTAAMGTPGQNGLLTFAGTANDRISLKGTNGLSGQIAIVCDVNTTIFKPDGLALSGGTACMEGSGFIDTQTLPATGTYKILVDPTTYATGNLTLNLYSVTDYSGSITAGGSSVTPSLSTPGQNGTLTFSGTSGQRISLKGSNGLTGQILGCDVNTSIKDPDGSTLASPTCMEGSGFIDVQTLSATGTHTIFVDPVSFATGNLTLDLYDVPADTTGTVTIGGSAVAVSPGTPGQNGTLSFSGTASQQVTVHLTNNKLGNVTVKLLKPDGTQLTSTTSVLSSFNLATQTLPTTGTYTIVVDPPGATTGSINVSVTNP
jgi:YD repeat-containing protein